MWNDVDKARRMHTWSYVTFFCKIESMKQRKMVEEAANIEGL